jgi:hypothetical protein
VNVDIRNEDQEVIAYLESLADLENFYLHRFNQNNRCLIQYFDQQGQPWALMEDDDAFVARCVEFLKKYGAPEFDDVEDMKAFESERLLRQ